MKTKKQDNRISLLLINNLLGYLFFLHIRKKEEVFGIYTSNPGSNFIDISIKSDLSKKNFKNTIKLIVLILKSWIKPFGKLYIGYPTIYSVIISVFARYSDLIYLDDGSTYLEIINSVQSLYIKQLNKAHLKKIIFKILRVNTDSVVLTSNRRLKAIIVFIPDIYQNNDIYKNLLVHDARNYLPDKSEMDKVFKMNVGPLIEEKNILIITQPFHELGLDSMIGDSLKDIRDILVRYSDHKVYIKPHPRESKNKYISLSEKIRIIDSNIPVELVIYSFTYKIIFGYYSASLFSGLIDEKTLIVSLINKDNSQQAEEYYNKIIALSKYFPNLRMRGNKL